MSTIAQQLPPLINNNISPQKKCYWEIIGAASLGLISALALGLIFGPLAAVAGFFNGGTIGAYLGLKISSCFSKNITIAEENAEIDRLLAEIERKKQESAQLTARYNEINGGQ